MRTLQGGGGVRRDTNDARHDVLAEDALPKPRRRAALHQQQHGRRAVADLARVAAVDVAAVDAAVLCERRLDAAERLGRDARAHAVVLSHRDLAPCRCLRVLVLHGQWRDLGVELAGEGVLLRARDAAVARHRLGEHAHRHLA
ncbi:hypothetical protein V502_03641 [Pseudogymnoascus sp. VKM F-4520 (FW-2644)]|nr:hypothetical protein V502_03641 [Pseudogymnoascus sp. VKM F-4520 (FW-2644)]